MYKAIIHRNKSSSALGNEKSTEESGTIPTAPASVSDSSDEDSIGCLVADLGYVKDINKKGGFLKWELALRSGNRGFIYVGYFSIGKSSGTWDIKNGLNWTDYFTTINEDGNGTVSTINGFGGAEVNISLANKHEWNSKGQICSLDNSGENVCGSANQWEFQRYVGFWEQNGNGDKYVTDAIKIAAKENNQQTEHLHDIWSQTDFDFSKSTQKYDEGYAWSKSLGSVYDAETQKWKNAGTSKDATSYLKAIYSPWAKKKGTWMEAEEVCYESNSRSLRGEADEAKRLLKFCYKK